MAEQKSGFRVAFERLQEEQNLIQLAAKAFGSLTDPNPGDVTEYWKERLARLSEKAKMRRINPGKCDRSHGEIQDLRGQRPPRTLIAHKSILEDLVIQGRLYPETRSWALQRDHGITNVALPEGYLDVEDITEAPNRDLPMSEAQRRIAAQGRLDMSLPLYVTGSQERHDRTGEFYDHNFQTATTLPGSRSPGGVLLAFSLGDGYLHVDRRFFPELPHQGWGFRSAGVKKS